jgi:sugar phosphate isomerase/epimerase
MFEPRVSLALAGMRADEAARDPRALIRLAALLGFRAVQLDASSPGLRPRELDRSARRDLAALLRRMQLDLSGLDLWIPPAHLIEAGTVDRAMTALVGAMELVADLARLLGSNYAVVSTALPEKLAPETLGALADAADHVGAQMADHAWPARASLGPVGVGVDPAAMLLAGADPVREVARSASTPSAARVNDAMRGGRVALGSGTLDLLAYKIALSTKGYMRDLVVDVRGVADQQQAAAKARDLLVPGPR